MIRFPENSFDPDLSLERISRRQKFNTNGFEKYLKSAISFLSGSLDTFFSRYPLTEITHRFFVTSDGRRQYIAASDGKSVAVLDLLNLTWLEIDGATTINLEGVHSLKWVGRDSSTLLVGTNFGFAAYSISSLGLSRATFFPHPHRKPISRLDAAPYGRLVVTWSRGDSCLYIWDILLGSFTPVLFGDGSDCDFSWSPSGSHIAIHRSTGAVYLLETNFWTHHYCFDVEVDVDYNMNKVHATSGHGNNAGCQRRQNTHSLCWLNSSVFLLAGQVHTKPNNDSGSGESPPMSPAVYWCTVDANDCNASVVSVSPAPVPLSTAAVLPELIKASASVYQMESDCTPDSVGRLVAVSFTSSKGASENSTVDGSDETDVTGTGTMVVLPFVAVYLCRCTPTLSVTLIEVLRSPTASTCATSTTSSSMSAAVTGATTTAVPQSFTFTKRAGGQRNSSIVSSALSRVGNISAGATGFVSVSNDYTIGVRSDANISNASSSLSTIQVIWSDGSITSTDIN